MLFVVPKSTVIPSECLIVWIQIRPDVLSGLVWVQTVCNCYQQMRLVGKELNYDIQNYVTEEITYRASLSTSRN